MKSLALEYLDWDSKQLGFQCGLIDCTRLKNLPQPGSLIDKIGKLCAQKNNLDFITIKLPGNYQRVVDPLVKMGASFIDMELTFSYAGLAARDVGSLPDNLKFKFCKKFNPEVFIPLAREMRLSRFFVDPLISKNNAIRLWEASIRNHCVGFADQLLIAHYNGKPAGIVAINLKDGRRVFLHIVGVLKEMQGKKIARFMLSKIIEKYAKDYSIFVETQPSNVAAQTVYQKMGFKYYDLKYVLHYWKRFALAW